MTQSRLFLLLLLIWTVGLGPSTAAPCPNVVFILADDLGWADTTLYGHTSLYETPNIQRLAARGMTFTRAYTSSPLCSPTRSAILTGLHPARTGLTTPNCHKPEVVLQTTVGQTAKPNQKLLPLSTVTRLDPKYPTLSRTLKTAGYTTVHFGKWHLGPEPYSPLQHGFDIDIPHHPGPGPAGSYVAPWKFKSFKERTPKEHIEDRIGDEAVAFLEENHDRPFFLNYWMFSVHGPFDAKAELIEKHRSRIDPKDEQRSPTYAAMIESMDDNIGKILDALDRLALTDNTILVFYSDNGGNMYNEIDSTTPTANRPLRGGKGNNWDGGVRVPCVIAWPGEVAPGSTSDTLITSTDFYPTILDALGLSANPGQGFDGVSILPALRGEPLERDTIFTYFPHSTRVPDTLPPSVAVYRDDYKLLRLFHQGDDQSHDYRLYNLKEDIGERTDLAAQQPERVAALSTIIDTFLTDTGAVTPQPNPAYAPNAVALAKTGWHTGSNSSLALANGALTFTATGTPSNCRAVLPKPVPAGEITVTFRLKTPTQTGFMLRWEEQGVKPIYFKDRRLSARSKSSPNWQDLTFTFTAKQALLSFRLDPAIEEGAIEFDRCTVATNDQSAHTWNFD